MPTGTCWLRPVWSRLVTAAPEVAHEMQQKERHAHPLSSWISIHALRSTQTKPALCHLLAQVQRNQAIPTRDLADRDVGPPRSPSRRWPSIRTGRWGLGRNASVPAGHGRRDAGCDTRSLLPSLWLAPSPSAQDLASPRGAGRRTGGGPVWWEDEQAQAVPGSRLRPERSLILVVANGSDPAGVPLGSL